MNEKQMDNFQKLVEFINKKLHIHPEPGFIIDENTQIYYDLGIFSDDFVEMLEWLHTEYGVKGPIDILRFGPKERTLDFIWIPLKKIFRIPDREYERLSVGQILDLMDYKEWPSSLDKSPSR